MSAFRGRTRNRASFEAQIAGLGAQETSRSSSPRRGRSSLGRGGRESASAREPSPDIDAPSVHTRPPKARRGGGGGSALNGLMGARRPSPKRGGGPARPAVASTSRFARLAIYSDSDEESEDEDDDNDESDEDMDVDTSSRGKRKGKGRGKSLAKKGKKAKDKTPRRDGDELLIQPNGNGSVRAGVTLTPDEMVHNSLLYFLLMQHKKLPVKRSDIIKHAMNDQGKAFPAVMGQLGTVFENVLGMKIHGMEASAKTGQVSSFMLTSDFNLSVSDIVTERNADVDYKRCILFIILSIIFMLNRSLEEDTIWKILTELQLNEAIDPIEEDEPEGADDSGGINTVINWVTRREDLARFIKKEYVSTMYLSAETEQNITRYSWGKRAELEFSKYKVLKFVCKYFPGKRPCDFMDQYNIVREQEGEAIEQDLASDERTIADMENDREALEEALARDAGSDSSHARRRHLDDHRDSSPEKSLSLRGRTRGRVVTPLEEAETETEEGGTSLKGGIRSRGSIVGSVRSGSGTKISVTTGSITDSSTSPDRGAAKRRRPIIIESDEGDDEGESEPDNITRTGHALNGVISPTRGGARATRRSAKQS